MLRLCLALFGGTDFPGFEAALEQSREIVEKLGSQQLMGEWYLLSAFREFPDIPRMKAQYQQAAQRMSAPSQLFNRREPYMFGTTSMWYLFYRTPGKMMETADELRDMLEVYNPLTGNHGAGPTSSIWARPSASRGALTSRTSMPTGRPCCPSSGRTPP